MALVEVVAMIFMDVDEVAMEDNFSEDYDSDDSIGDESDYVGVAMEMMKILKSQDKARKQMMLLDMRLQHLKRRMIHAELSENYAVHESSKRQHAITSAIRELYNLYKLDGWTRVQRMASSVVNQMTGRDARSLQNDDIINDTDEDTLDNCDILFVGRSA